MDSTKEKYLTLAVNRLRKWIPFNTLDMLAYYKENDLETVFEENEYHYCLFSWPLLDINNDPVEKLGSLPILLERIVLLVYDDQDRIIADCSGVHCKTKDLVTNKGIFDYLCDESDWMYLEHYTLCGVYFPDLAYPFCEATETVSLPQEVSGEVLLYGNAYVTRSFREQGIFRNMTEMMREYVLRNAEGQTYLYTAFAMDPDIAYYGPDAVPERYVYSFEKDEPDRLRNAEIAKKLGFVPIRLEETEHDENSDGTKLWFSVKKERILLIDEEYEV